MYTIKKLKREKQLVSGKTDNAPADVKSPEKSHERSTTGKKRKGDEMENENINVTNDIYGSSTSKIRKLTNQNIEEESKKENYTDDEDEMSGEEKNEETDDTDLVTVLESDDQEL